MLIASHYSGSPVSFYEFEALLKTIILPPAGPLILSITGFLVARLTRWKLPGDVLCAIGLAILWLLATPVVAGQLMKWGKSQEVLDLRQPVSADAIVILGGGIRRYGPEYNDEAPNEITLQRLAYGVRVAHTTGLPVLVTGGRGEARVMRQFLVADFGITPRWVEDQALNTRENARYSAAILKREGIRSVVLVTSSLHMTRAASEFRAQGLIVTAAPVAHYSPPDGIVARWVPGIAGLRDSRNVLYEVLARASYRLSGDTAD